jgi:hypothetical protein
MDHRQILADAINTLQDRGQDYGDVSELFERACSIYNLTTGESFTPWQANIFMTSLKMARIKSNRPKADNYIDGINYLAFAGQFANASTGRVAVSMPNPVTSLRDVVTMRNEASDMIDEGMKSLVANLAPERKGEA